MTDNVLPATVCGIIDLQPEPKKSVEIDNFFSTAVNCHSQLYLHTTTCLVMEALLYQILLNEAAR